tara:strand:+ start:179 stop:337 length:159 start_codon:yes stop_codon:yes gene_type:complete
MSTLREQIKRKLSIKKGHLPLRNSIFDARQDTGWIEALEYVLDCIDGQEKEE